jgi:hypothetical protein
LFHLENENPVLKSLFISIWAIIVTIGMVFLPTLFSGDTTEDGPKAAALIDHRTDTMSAALFEDGEVVGHFTTRIRYQMPDGAVDPEVVPVDQIIMDGLFELIHKMQPKEMARLRDPELAVMGDDLAQLLNNRRADFPITNVRFDSARLMLKSAIR